MTTTRLSIEISPEQKQQIKALAALNGMSVKDYVLKQAIGRQAQMSEEEAWLKLRGELMPAVEAAEAGSISRLSFDDIIAEADAERPA